MEINFIILKEILEFLYNDLGFVKVIIELGARDCKETLLFEENYPNANILTFECNPATLPLCRERVSGRSRITLFEKAVSNTNGKVSFYPINSEKTETTWADGNPGASSLFRASGKYPVEKYVQDKIEVDVVTLDTVLTLKSIDEVDVLWMDIQGAELMALKGFEKHIQKVKVIHTEVEFMEIYTNQPLAEEIKDFLMAHNFQFMGFTTQHRFAGDAVFLNKDYFTEIQLINIDKIIKKRTKEQLFQRIKRVIRSLWIK